MNYLKIYQKLMHRAKLEGRQKDKEYYYESHHIVPDFMFANRSRKGPSGHLPGDPNAKENKVLLTEREHILAHILLAKGLHGKRYWAQASSALSWFFTKVIGEHVRQKNRVAGAMRKYERYRKMGIAGISAARKGTMPVKDVITGEMQGSVTITHPKVLSGEWVHHSLGKEHASQKGHRRSCGEKNGNYKELTAERCAIIFECISKSTREKNGSLYFIKKDFEPELKRRAVDMGLKKISGVFIRNKFSSYENMVNQYNMKFGTNIIVLHSTQRLFVDYSTVESFRWYTNGKENTQVKVSQTPPTGFTIGKTKEGIYVKNQKN